MNNHATEIFFSKLNWDIQHLVRLLSPSFICPLDIYPQLWMSMDTKHWCLMSMDTFITRDEFLQNILRPGRSALLHRVWFPAEPFTHSQHTSLKLGNMHADISWEVFDFFLINEILMTRHLPFAHRNLYKALIINIHLKTYTNWIVNLSQHVASRTCIRYVNWQPLKRTGKFCYKYTENRK